MIPKVAIVQCVVNPYNDPLVVLVNIGPYLYPQWQYNHWWGYGYNPPLVGPQGSPNGDDIREETDGTWSYYVGGVPDWTQLFAISSWRMHSYTVFTGDVSSRAEKCRAYGRPIGTLCQYGAIDPAEPGFVFPEGYRNGTFGGSPQSFGYGANFWWNKTPTSYLYYNRNAPFVEPVPDVDPAALGTEIPQTSSIATAVFWAGKQPSDFPWY